MAGHTGGADTARRALADPDPGVRAGALVALARLGVLGDDEVAGGLRDPDPSVRRRACEVQARREVPGAGLDGTEHVASLVRACLEDGSPEVCEAACFSLGERPGTDVAASVRALSRVATGHDDSLCREAAVAALGAIGDPAGAPTVIAALSDKLAVRRRAAVALAAFDGPEAQEALRLASKSRDWQVRQIAEDLLADRSGDRRGLS